MNTKQILEHLEENYWDAYYLEREIPDQNKRSTFVWDALQNGLMTSPDATRLVVHHVDDLRVSVLVNFLNLALDSEQRTNGILGVSYDHFELFRQLAQSKPEFQKSIPLLHEPLQSVAWMQFKSEDVIADLPESAYETLAEAWVGTSDTWFFEPFKAEIDTATFKSQVLKTLASPRIEVRAWERVRPLLPVLDVKTALNVAMRLESSPTATKLVEILKPHGKEVLDAMNAFVLAHDNDYSVAPFAAVTCALHQRCGVTPPAAVVARMALATHQYYPEDTAVIAEGLMSASEDQRKAWLKTGLRNSSTNIAAGLLGVIADTTFHFEAVRTFVTMANKDYLDQMSSALARSGDCVSAPLMDVWEEKIAAVQGELLVRALAKLKVQNASIAEFYVQAVGHSSKGVTAAAELALSELGAVAIPALEEGTKAKKKSVREFCETALQAAKSAAENPTIEVSEAERKTIIDALNKGYKEYQYRDTLKQMVEADPAKWVTVAAEHALKKGNDYERRNLLHIAFESAPTSAAFRIYVDAASKGDWGSKYGAKEFLGRIKGGYGAPKHRDFDAVLGEVLQTPGGPYQSDLLELYLEMAAKPDVDFLLTLLESTSKVARDGAVAQLAKHGQPLVGAISELLTSKKKDVRAAAAEALAVLDAKSALKAIQTALAKEKSADVVASLEKALQAAGGEVKGAEVSSDASVSELEKLLEGQPKKKMPKFLNLGALPALKWADGRTLGNGAIAGLLSRLALEGPDHVDDIARAIRPHLDDVSANAFSVAIKDQWAAANGKAADKWCIYQQGILADEARMSAFAPSLDLAAGSGLHHLAGWYIDVLERHGSRDAMSWVAYWAANAERRSLREKAWASVEQMAKAQSLSVQAFMASVNTYIADDVADMNTPTLGFAAGNQSIDLGGKSGELQVDASLNLVIRDDEGKVRKTLPKDISASEKERVSTLKKQLKSVAKDAGERFEFAMVSGRPWTVAAFTKTIGTHPILSMYVAPLLFRTEAGKVFRFSEGEFVGADWAPMSLKADDVIRLAHRLDLSAADIETWGNHLGEGEITQPFEQLNRPVFAKKDEVSFGRVMPGTLSGRLRRMGWRNDSAEDAGMVYGASKLYAGRGVRARCSHGGFYIGDASWGTDAITVESYAFEDLRGGDISTIKVNEIAYSEAIFDLTRACEQKA